MIKLSSKDVMWSYAGYFSQAASNIILLPFILKFLQPVELGLWYTFVSVGTLVNLLDFGFLPTIMRNVSYCWSGAAELQPKGIANISHTDEPNYILLKKVIKVSKKIYLFIALLALLVLATLGTIYILKISSSIKGKTVLAAWGFYCGAIFLNLYYSYWNPCLRGIGAIKESQKAMIISRTSQILSTVAGLYLHLGLIAVTFSSLLSGIILREVSRRYFIRFNGLGKILDGITSGHSQKEFNKLFKTVWYNAWRFGLVSLGAFMITQSNTLICSYFFGLENTSKYGLSLQVFGVIGAFASVVLNSSLPMLNETSLLGDKDKAKKIISVAMCTSWISYLVAATVVVLWGPALLKILGAKASMLDIKVLILMAVYLFLEFNHSMFANIISTHNQIPFTKAAIISGVAIVAISLSMASFTNFGITGLLLTQSVVQLSYNNWKWPWSVKKEYGLKLHEMFGTFFSFSINKLKYSFNRAAFNGKSE
jgi:O-antigen/teichoic acid export membrane protein